MPNVYGESALPPKAFPLHSDTLGYFYDEPAMQAEIAEMEDITVVKEGLLGSFYPQPTYRRLYRKHKAKFNDPFCLYYVLDLLVKQQRGTYVRPHYLLARLQDLTPMYWWDVRSLGRLLSGIAAAAVSEYDFWTDERRAPFAKGRDARGTYYVIDPLGGNEGLAWLLNCRKRMMQRCEAIMRAESQGDLEHTNGEPEHRDSVREWIPGDLYSEAWLKGTRVRTQEYYLEQCDHQPFHRSAPIHRTKRTDPFE